MKNNVQGLRVEENKEKRRIEHMIMLQSDGDGLGQPAWAAEWRMGLGFCPCLVCCLRALPGGVAGCLAWICPLQALLVRPDECAASCPVAGPQGPAQVFIAVLQGPVAL